MAAKPAKRPARTSVAHIQIMELNVQKTLALAAWRGFADYSAVMDKFKPGRVLWQIASFRWGELVCATRLAPPDSAGQGLLLFLMDRLPEIPAISMARQPGGWASSLIENDAIAYDPGKETDVPTKRASRIVVDLCDL
jgi:hypothetical protein